MSSTTTGHRPSGWVVGLAYFAGSMMVLSGLFGALSGIAAIFRNDVYVFRGDYVFKWDLTAWGWVHLAIGVLIFLAGLAVFAAQAWGRAVGIVLAVLSAVANFLFLPYYPLWSVLIIVLNVLVIWALTMYNRRAGGSAAQ
ncbi:hypothetical protein ACFMQL_36525 [Nonomuraea fastidiosa]|jgi:hypothetical protein|uniref:DUF7144 family membrane protein n=1 Tax=Nonomuraea TaxID=83681 RepID=UPI00324C4DC2